MYLCAYKQGEVWHQRQRQRLSQIQRKIQGQRQLCYFHKPGALSTNTCKSNLVYGVTDPCFLHIDDFCKQATTEPLLFPFGLVDWITQSRLSHENRCGQVSYLQQKHWCPRQLNPIFWQWSFNNFSLSEIFLPYLVLWKLMSECLNRQFVICTSERDIYWDSSLCIIRMQSVPYPSYIKEPNSSTYPF